MSDNMERDEESSAAKEIKQKKMERELKDVGMYEPGYTYDEMESILNIISESKVMANIAKKNQNVQKESLQSSNDCTSDVISKTNVSQESERQEHVDASKSIPSFKSSPETMSGIFESRNSTHRCRSSDSDDIFNKPQDKQNMRDACSHSTNIYVSPRSKNSVQEPYNTHTAAEDNMETQSEYNSKLDRWQINPLDSCVSENDVPLRQPDRPLVQVREPFRSCKDAQTPEAIEKLLPALNLHLKQTAELWRSWHRTADSNFQWGSPIQVGTARVSSDKKSLNIKTEQNKSECTGKYSLERSNKRKSAMSSSNSRRSSSDEEEKVELIKNKRKKTQFVEASTRVLRPKRNIRFKEPLSPSIFEDDLDNVFDDNDTDFDKEDTKNVQKKYNEEPEEAPMSPELISKYSRRIVPRKHRKRIKEKKHSDKVSSNSSSHSNENPSAMTRMPNKSSSVNDKEIIVDLQKDDNENCEKKNAEIKPLPLKSVSDRLKEQLSHLKDIQIEKVKRQEVEEEETRRKEDEERRRKEEFYKRQIEERQQKQKQREEIEKLRTEKSTQWNHVLKSKERREKSWKPREVKESRTLTSEDEDRLLEDSDTNMSEQMEIVEDVLDDVNCPICNELFPSDKIETHAAECEQYSPENDEGNSGTSFFQSKAPITRKNIDDFKILECSVCSKYKSTNGIQYEEHVNNCLQEQHRQESSRSYDSTNVDIDNIPTSPIRCYQPISEQADSEIDYKEQFGSKRQIHTNKKRKCL